MGKIPLSELYFQTYPTSSVKELKSFVECRQIKVGGVTATHINELFPKESELTLEIPKYVSRGGYKLEHALKEWQIDVTKRVFVDAGASSGGFTDALLQHGCPFVHTVDVGYNQLDYRLRYDKRVLVHERTNIMEVTNLDPSCHAAVIDLSFRSIVGAAKHILFLTSEKWAIALIKPQFEISKEAREFTGVVDDWDLLRSTLLSVYCALQEEGVNIEAFVESPIRGRKGNREFLALLTEKRGLSESHFTTLVNSLPSM